VSLVLIAVGVAAYVVHWFVKHHRNKAVPPHPKARKSERRICFS
jgi:hypothetical protein